MKPVCPAQFGDSNIIQGVRLLGDPRNPEPETYQVAFPGGEVAVTRTTDGNYWVHVRVNREGAPGCLPKQLRDEVGHKLGRLRDARLDILGKHVQDSDIGDFDNPNLYHLAVLVEHDR